MPERRIAVVGGGVSGLSAARSLSEHYEITLFESSPELGGKLRSVRFRGRPLDPGPDAFIRRNPAALELAAALGLGEQLIAPASRRAFVYARGALRTMPERLAIGIPTDLRALWSSGVISKAATLRAAADLIAGRLLPTGIGGDDPSVAQVIAPRLGRAILDALVDPLVGGINASDVDALSFAAALPQLVPLRTRSASLMRAFRPLASTGSAPGGPPVFAGLSGGIEGLPIALVGDLQRRGVDLRVRSPVRALQRLDGARWRVEDDHGAGDYDGLVLALPAYGAAALLAPVESAIAQLLDAIPYAGVVTATFAFSERAVPPAVGARLSAEGADEAVPLPGAGVLVARAAGRLTTAVSFTSTKWPASTGEGEILLRLSAGRHGDRRALELDDDALASALLGDLHRVLGIDDAPLDRVIVRFPDSFPQYVKGHLARVVALREQSRALPPIVLVGAAYDGIGIPACISSANDQAEVLGRALTR